MNFNLFLVDTNKIYELILINIIGLKYGNISFKHLVDTELNLMWKLNSS